MSWVESAAGSDFPIENLPYDIAVTGLTVQPDGVLLTGTGRDIPVRGG